jgi:hypothetical protein
MSTQGAYDPEGSCICPDCGYTVEMYKGYHLNCPNPKKEYVELQVNDEEIKYKKLCESQERHIERLEAEIQRLKEELLGVDSRDALGASTPEPPVVDHTSNTLPQGIVLKSKFRETVEEQLRQKAIQKQEENK